MKRTPSSPVLAGALVLFLILFSTSMGSSETSGWVGRVSLEGAFPFTRLVLTTSEGRQWRLTGDQKSALETLGNKAQGKWVRVQGMRQGDEALLVSTWSLEPEPVPSPSPLPSVEPSPAP